MSYNSDLNIVIRSGDRILLKGGIDMILELGFV